MELNYFRDKQILVTGGTGLIGYNLSLKLLAMPIAKLFVTGRSISKLSDTFNDIKDGRLMLIEHDASNPIPSEIDNIDIIFHAAGPMEREIVQNRPVDVVLPNIIGTTNLLELLRKQTDNGGNKSRIVIFSSVTVYNNITDKDLSVQETDTCQAISLDASNACYAESKRMSEVIAKAYHKQYGIDAVIARFSTVYGFTKNIPNTAFFEFINKAIAGNNIILNGAGFPRRDNIYINDAVDGLLAIACNGQSGESYNISSGGELGNFAAVDEIANVIAETASELLGKKPVEVVTNSELPRKPGLSLDNTKIKSLGWSLETSMKEGIKNTINQIINRL